MANSQEGGGRRKLESRGFIERRMKDSLLLKPSLSASLWASLLAPEIECPGLSEQNV
jgi:hypothetical protein